MAWGENSADIIRRTVRSSDHRCARIALPGPPARKGNHRPGGAEDLTRISHPWKVTSCEWNDKLIRRAIVWLCSMTGKPILKLTDKDYKDWGLGELLALYGSAYNVNIKIFNDLQHTITRLARRQTQRRRHISPRACQPLPQARYSILAPPRRRRYLDGRHSSNAS